MAMSEFNPVKCIYGMQCGLVSTGGLYSPITAMCRGRVSATSGPRAKKVNRFTLR